MHTEWLRVNIMISDHVSFVVERVTGVMRGKLILQVEVDAFGIFKQIRLFLSLINS